ncbi:MAG: hypothetical protein Q4F79_01875 [Eubacteriales bacterium]|nr:hypothetical protein [Eubacteriales bacterium]
MTEKDLQLTHDRWESIVLNRAIEVYGVGNQIDQAEQELIELLDALKHRRRPDRITNIYEELADVGIMLDQLKLIFHCEEIVSNIRAQKLARLEQRMKGGLRHEPSTETQ